MTGSDQNCPTKGAYFAMIFLLKKCVKLSDIFINPYFFIWVQYSFIKDYEELLFSLEPTVTQISTTLSLKISSSSKINCGHCWIQLNIPCPIIGQLDIHCPIIGQLDIYCKTSLVRRLQVQTLPDATPPAGKIHSFSKIAVTFEPIHTAILMPFNISNF